VGRFNKYNFWFNVSGNRGFYLFVFFLVPWLKNMKFKDLSLYLKELEKISSRIEITKILAELFKKSTKDEIGVITYLILGTLAPSFRAVVFNLADRMMIEVLAKAYHVSADSVRKLYKTEGDLGNVANKLAQISNLPPAQRLRRAGKSQISQFSVSEVYNDLLSMAQDEGGGSVERKIEKMAEIISKLDPLSAKYVVRIPLGRLRLGFSDKTILDALSWMEFGDKSAKVLLDKAYQVTPDVGLLAKKVKEMGIKKATKNIKPLVGVPVAPMLAQRLKDPSDMVTKMGVVAVEPKFDGLRLLIHFKRGKGKNKDFLKAFTRNLNDVSNMFPELLGIGEYINAREAILDTETVGMDPDLVKMANFQTTMQRRRKYNIDALKFKVPVRFQIFDIIYKDGKNLMDKSYVVRRSELEKTVKKNNVFVVDRFWLTNSPDEISKRHKEMIDDGLEGVIVKRADSRYVPGRTGWRWVKMKETVGSEGKLLDTVDCVVMGFTAGKGKRATFGLGQFLVGVKSGERFKTVTKIGTGLSDEEFRGLNKYLLKIKVAQKPKQYDVHKNLEPDNWVTPQVVVEIAADNITKSPTHTAGYALRFPRLVRFRDDKSPAQSTTVSELKKLFKLQ